MTIGMTLFVIVIITLLLMVLAVQIQISQINGELGEIKRELSDLIGKLTK